MVKKTDKNDLEKLNSAFWMEVGRLKLDQDLRFLQSVEAYEFQIDLIETLRAAITAEGCKIEIPVGRDGVKLVSNPSIGDLNKAEILAQKLRMEMDSKIEKARQTIPESPEITL